MIISLLWYLSLFVTSYLSFNEWLITCQSPTGIKHFHHFSWTLLCQVKVGNYRTGCLCSTDHLDFIATALSCVLIRFYLYVWTMSLLILSRHENHTALLKELMQKKSPVTLWTTQSVYNNSCAHEMFATWQFLGIKAFMCICGVKQKTFMLLYSI